MDYKASTDGMVKIVTVFVTILFCFIIYRMLLPQNAPAHPGWPFVSYGFIVFLVVTYFICFGLCTWKYRVTDGALTIVAPLYNKTINKADIQKVGQIEDGLGTVVRTGGIGGLFGYYGWYRSSKVGSFFYYGTQSKNRILIQMKDGEKYVITPDDVSMLSAIQPLSN